MKVEIAFFMLVLISYPFFAVAADTEGYLYKIEPALIEKIVNNLDEEHRAIVWLDENSELRDENVLHAFDIISAAVVKADGYALLEYAKKDFVEKITEDRKVSVFRSDAMQIIDYNSSKDYGVSGSDIKVAVIDTGVFNHTEFGDRIVKQKCFCSDDCCFNNSIESDIATDDHGHGTHCAGTIAGSNGIAANASLFAVKVLDASGSGYDSDIVNGINWAVENGANVISISFGLQYSEFDDCYKLGTSLAVSNASNYAVVIVSAGNDGPGNETIAAPACVKNALAVGSVSKSGLISTFSSKGPTKDGRIKPDIVAPGEKIKSTFLNDKYRSFSGTSMSAPFVSGAAALLMEKYNQVFGSLPSPHLVKTILLNSANSTERDSIYGSGILDVEQSLAAVEHAINGTIENEEKIFNASYRTTLYWHEHAAHNNLSMIIHFNNTNTTLLAGNDTLLQFWMNDSYQVIVRANLSEPQQFFLVSFNISAFTINENFTNTTNDTNNTKLVPTIRLWINGTESNYTCNRSSIINITAQTNDSLAISIYTNFSAANSIFNSSFVLVNTPELNASTYNITAYTAGDENYTEASVTAFLTIVEQNISDAFATTTTTTTSTTEATTTTTAVASSGGGSSGGGGAYAYTTTTTTTTVTTTTTSAIATTTTTHQLPTTTTTIPKYQIHEEDVAEEKPKPAATTGFFVFETPLLISLSLMVAFTIAIIFSRWVY